MNILKEGDKAPAFSAKDQDGKEVNLTDFAGKKLILFFILKIIPLVVLQKHAT